MPTGDFRPACECCNDTGYYGDNGPGIKGNREYQRCDQCGVEPPVLDEIDTLRRQLAAANERVGELEKVQEELRGAWAPVLSRRGDETVDLLMMVGCYETLDRILGGGK